jgi:hypothetical protein
MKTTFYENPYEVDEGRFLARFLGESVYYNPEARGKDGKSIDPGYKWEWELSEGPDTGKRVNIITGQVPSLKNKCGRIIMALANGNLFDGSAFDSSKFVGFYYRVTIRDGLVSDNPSPSFVGTQRPSDAPEEDMGPI